MARSKTICATAESFPITLARSTSIGRSLNYRRQLFQLRGSFQPAAGTTSPLSSSPALTTSALWTSPSVEIRMYAHRSRKIEANYGDSGCCLSVLWSLKTPRFSSGFLSTYLTCEPKRLGSLLSRAGMSAAGCLGPAGFFKTEILKMLSDSIQQLDKSPDEYKNLWAAYAANCRPLMRRPELFEDALCNLLEGTTKGYPLKWEPRLAFRPGEFTLWGGLSGHGKSLITGQVAMQLANAGQRVCIISLEMTVVRTLARMCRQCLQHPLQVEDEDTACEWLRWASKWLVLYDRLATVTAEEISGAVICAARDFGCQQIIIDNMMRCVAGEGDFDGQKRLAENLSNLAKAFNAHIHLIAHLSKTTDDERKPTRAALRGGSAVYDLCDNCLLLWRNMGKERKRIEQKGLSIEDDEALPDAVLCVTKQRNGDWTGEVPLWFDAASTAFCEDVARCVEALSPQSPSSAF